MMARTGVGARRGYSYSESKVRSYMFNRRLWGPSK